MSAASEREHTGQGLERKRQLLDAAAALFTERGYAQTRISDICAAAGVAKGLFYWYYPTKESLFAELVREMRQELRRAQGAAMNPDDDPLTRIRRATEATVRFFAAHATYFALLHVERADPRIADILREGSDVYAADTEAAVREAQRCGLIADEDIHLMAIGLMSGVASFSHAYRSGRIAMPLDEFAAAVGRWVLRAMGAQTALG